MPQAEAARTLAELENAVIEENRIEWRRAFLDTLVKFWHRLDYYRVNKFLDLVAELLTVMYRNVLAGPNPKLGLKEFNLFLTETVIDREEGRGILLEIIYRCREIFLEQTRLVSLLFLACKPYFDVN